jgi:preprotein translocase subunit SecE
MAKEDLTSEKKKDKTPAKSSAKNQKKQPNKVAKYFKDLKSEFKKVVWPTKKQVINNTTVVLVTIIILGVLVGAFDTLGGWVLKMILNK